MLQERARQSQRRNEPASSQAHLPTTLSLTQLRVFAQSGCFCPRETGELGQAQRLTVDTGARLVLLAGQVQPARVLNCLLVVLARERCTDWCQFGR
ncbi:hypothetical protein BBJ41_38240 [Burkholderia stabilis]|nr:hypothetical protein BBJ41_38240 [Burkholderia stabilis]